MRFYKRDGEGRAWELSRCHVIAVKQQLRSQEWNSMTRPKSESKTSPLSDLRWLMYAALESHGIVWMFISHMLYEKQPKYLADAACVSLSERTVFENVVPQKMSSVYLVRADMLGLRLENSWSSFFFTSIVAWALETNISGGREKPVKYFRCTFFKCLQSWQTWSLSLFYWPEEKNKIAPTECVQGEDGKYNTQNTTRSVSVNPSTFSIIVHKEWASPRCQQLESCEVNWREHRGRRPCWPWTLSHMWLSLRWQHNHNDPAAHNTQVIHQTATNTPTFLISLAPDKVSSMCPIFVAPVLQPAASCCYAATGFIGPRQAARLTYYITQNVLCIAPPSDRPTSAQTTCFTILNCLTLVTLPHTQTRTIGIHVDGVRIDEGREREKDKARALSCGFSVSFFFLTCLFELTCLTLPHSIFGVHPNN